MQNYNKDNLKVGGLAIIISTTQPQNKHLIGHTVTVEEIVEVGEMVNSKWLRPEMVESMNWDYELDTARAVVSGISATNSLYIENHAQFDIRHLMPIGDDDLVEELFANEENPYVLVETA